MAIIKEFREFFLRNTKVTSGAKPDKELGFPTSYTVKGNTVFNRFLAGHFPSENVMKKFLESITFKYNPEDTATETIQGLGLAAKDQDSLNRVSPSTFARIVLPHQLTEVVAEIDSSIDTPVAAGSITVGGVTITPHIRVVNSRSRLIYLVEVPAIGGMIENYADPVGLKTVNLGATLLKSITIAPEQWVVGNQLEIEIVAEPTTFGSGGQMFLDIKIGGTAIDTAGHLLIGSVIDDSTSQTLYNFKLDIISVDSISYRQDAAQVFQVPFIQYVNVPTLGGVDYSSTGTFIKVVSLGQNAANAGRVVKFSVKSNPLI